MTTHYDDLKQAVVAALESSGVLAKLRAELTFSVFESVDATEHVPVNPKRDAFVATEDGVAALSLVQDLLTQLGLVCTSRLFEKEARLNQPLTREQLISRFGLPAGPPEGPLMSTLLSQATAPAAHSIQEGSMHAHSPIEPAEEHSSVKPTKDAEVVSDSFQEVENETPTRIPSFVGPTANAGKLQASQALSPDEASAPYPLPSDSGESMVGDAMPSLDHLEHEAQSPTQQHANMFSFLDAEEAVNTGEMSEVACTHEVGLDADCATDMMQKPAPAALAPISRKNLPPLGPMPGIQGAGLGMFNSSATDVDGRAMAAPIVRDARREGQELLGILGSPGSQSADDDLPDLQRLPDPDLFSDDGDMGGIAGLDLLLPESSSDSAAEDRFGV